MLELCNGENEKCDSEQSSEAPNDGTDYQAMVNAFEINDDDLLPSQSDRSRNINTDGDLLYYSNE